MFCAASVSYSDLLSELQRRQKHKEVSEEGTYFESLVFDLHMAQKSLQRAIYSQQVSAVGNSAPPRANQQGTATALLQMRLDYPER
jgi:hypothetical protein